MLRRVLLALALLAGGLLPALVPLAASAERDPRVTIRVSAERVVAGGTVRVTGTVRAPARRVTLLLQRRVDGAWTRVARTRVSPGATYAMRARVPQGTHRYRVRMRRTEDVRAATSPVVRVRGTATSTPPPPQEPPGDTELARVRAEVLRQTNLLRETHALPPLRPMDGLDRVAQRWTEHMASTGAFDHNPEFAAQYPDGWTNAGENIAYGYAVDRVVDAWAQSPGHRANMLGGFTHLGIGFARDAQGRPYYTQNFARY